MLSPKLNKLNAEFYIKLMRYAPQLYGLFYDTQARRLSFLKER
ncbi:MAG: hypothetical protein ABWK04_08450 [Hydrogenobacter sp.]